jgi:splicing factor 1
MYDRGRGRGRGYHHGAQNMNTNLDAAQSLLDQLAGQGIIGGQEQQQNLNQNFNRNQNFNARHYNRGGAAGRGFRGSVRRGAALHGGGALRGMVLALESAKEMQEYEKVRCVPEQGGQNTRLPEAKFNVNARKRRRANRFEDSSRGESATPPAMVQSLAPFHVMAAVATRARLDELENRLTRADLGVARLAADEGMAERSPSPPPVYGADGRRTNTREQRTRDKLMRERTMLVDEASRFSPSYRPPPGYVAVSLKKTRKVYIPVDKYPDYNFIGIIIGPRGTTQKKLELATGARIAIRGRGSTKHGRGHMHRRDEEQDALHVLITANTDEQIDKATAAINQLLVPVEDGSNAHKRQQLRKLAEFNGVLLPDYDSGGPPGSAPGGAAPPSNVFRARQSIKCDHCGQPSHPTADCPLQRELRESKTSAPPAVEPEFARFLEAVQGKSSAPPQEQPSAEATPPWLQQQQQQQQGGDVPPWLQAQAQVQSGDAKALDDLPPWLKKEKDVDGLD